MVFEEFRSFIVERKLAHPDKSVYARAPLFADLAQRLVQGCPTSR